MTVRLAMMLIAVLATTPALAQTDDASWPNRPIRFIVPFPAGSATDTLARLIGQKLGDRLRQNLVIENRVGASGNLGSDAIARSAQGERSNLMLGKPHVIERLVALLFFLRDVGIRTELSGIELRLGLAKFLLRRGECELVLFSVDLRKDLGFAGIETCALHVVFGRQPSQGFRTVLSLADDHSCAAKLR